MEKAMIPKTVLYPDAFLRSKSANNDGVFDWEWTSGCFGETKITPMDIDGFVERNGQFIVFETKDKGVQVKAGQQIALEQLHKMGRFTIVIIHGKLSPETAEVWYPKTKAKKHFVGIDEIRNLVSRWYAWADKSLHG
jgi:hypothetical protein